MLEIRKLYKRFENNEVLKGIDLNFYHSNIFAVLGPNSSGKSTLIKSILGIVIPQKGEILLNEKIFWANGIIEIKSDIFRRLLVSLKI